MPRTWTGVLARLGVPTGDGRIIDPVGGSSRDLPQPLMWQELSDDGHQRSEVIGRIETLKIGDGMVTASGSLLESAPWKAIEQLEAGVIGPSVDLDDVEYVMDAQERVVLTRWRVSGATLVSIPAFADVHLTLDPEPAEEPEDRARVPDPEDDIDWLREDGFVASAAPRVLPPLEWFARPDVDRLTPLMFSEASNGLTRVFGHIGGADTCHVGLPGCVTPPMGHSDYSHFHVAAQEVAEGGVLPVGTLVAGPRHADPQLAFRAAQEHYDDVDARVAKVVAGEDEFGIWVAGWLLPDAKPEAVEVFKSSPVSGDWRWIGGQLELIAVCSVNTPGFPVPRARVAFSSGAQRALVASFGITPEEAVSVPTGVRSGIIEDARAKWAWAKTLTEGREGN